MTGWEAALLLQRINKGKAGKEEYHALLEKLEASGMPYRILRSGRGGFQGIEVNGRKYIVL